MPRSISTWLTLALARRLSTRRRMAMSSWRRVVYSLSAYHFAVQVRETPSRKPYGWTLCPMGQASRSATTMVMWVMGLWIGKARPWARSRQRLIVGPSSATASATTRSSADRLWLFSALAVALLRTLAMSLAACWGMNRSNAAASSTGLPLMSAVTRRALRVEPRRYLAVAETRTG